jgi:hypothetical protein
MHKKELLPFFVQAIIIILYGIFTVFPAGIYPTTDMTK